MGRKEDCNGEESGEVRKVLLDSFNVPFGIGIDDNGANIADGV